MNSARTYHEAPDRLTTAPPGCPVHHTFTPLNDDYLDDPYPMLRPLAIYVNTLAKFGVPKENRKIAVVLHRGSGTIALKDHAFGKFHDGHDNPNTEMIKLLHDAGVSFHVCGQGVLARELDPEKDILPEIQVDYWALTTLIELRGEPGSEARQG